jgi:hypothetical protein
MTSGEHIRLSFRGKSGPGKARAKLDRATAMKRLLILLLLAAASGSTLRAEHPRLRWHTSVNLRTGVPIPDGPSIELRWQPHEIVVIGCDR